MKKMVTFSQLFLHVFRFAIATSPFYLVMNMLGSLGMAFGFVWQAETQKSFFEFAETFLLIDKSSDILPLLKYLTIFIIAYIIVQIMIHVSNCAEEILLFKLQRGLTGVICRKAAKMTPIYFEDPKILDDLNKAMKGKDNATNITSCVIALVCYYIPYFIIMSIWLFKLKPILVVLIPIAFIPSIVSYIAQIKMFADTENDSVNLRRRLQSCENSIIGKQQVKETRILGCFPFLFDLYKELLKNINQKTLLAQIRKQRVNIFLRLVKALGYVIVLAIVIFYVIKGVVSVGAFAAIFSSIGILFSNMDEAISRQFGTIAEEFGTTKNYIDFMNTNFQEYESKIGSEGMRLKNVSFTYPHHTEPVIKNVSLELKKGETLAIVGENGAGKSTLVKIIMGIYKPTQGEITYNEKKSDASTAVFQDHIRYALTLLNNVIISAPIDKDDIFQAETALNSAGISIKDKEFPFGFDTLLSTEFGGIDLSGGQWQRVAIARGMYKKSDILFFDEPTAAIDPLEESELNKKIAEAVSKKTAVIITHRMASIKFADRIVAMYNGKIVEIGNHDELMELNGVYRKLYEAQTSIYDKNVTLDGEI